MSGGFAADLSRFATGAIGRLEKDRRAVIIDLFSAVIKATPVLTGRLRGNWQTSVSSPLLGELPTRGAGTPQGQVPPELDREVDDAAANVKGDQPVYLRNNLPYAARIEFDGWSHSKAPEGMLRKNVVRFREILDRKAREGRL